MVNSPGVVCAEADSVTRNSTATPSRPERLRALRVCIVKSRVDAGFRPRHQVYTLVFIYKGPEIHTPLRSIHEQLTLRATCGSIVRSHHACTGSHQKSFSSRVANLSHSIYSGRSVQPRGTFCTPLH